jgi:hypothetical protein
MIRALLIVLLGPATIAEVSFKAGLMSPGRVKATVIREVNTAEGSNATQQNPSLKYAMYTVFPAKSRTRACIPAKWGNLKTTFGRWTVFVFRGTSYEDAQDADARESACARGGAADSIRPPIIGDSLAEQASWKGPSVHRGISRNNCI